MQKNKNHNNSLLSIIKNILDVIYPLHKKNLLLVLILLSLSALIDVLSFTLLVPIIYLISNPAPIEHNIILSFVYTSMHFKSNSSFILFLLVVLMFIFSLKNIILFYKVYFQNYFVFSVADSLLENQFVKFYNATYLDIRENNSIEYLRYTTTAPQDFVNILMQSVLNVFYEIIVILLVCVGLLLYFPKILIIILIIIIPISFVLLKISKNKIQEISNKKGISEVELYKVAFQSINGYLDIKLFNKEKLFSNVVSVSLKELLKIKNQTNLLELVPRRIFEIIIIFTIVIIYVFVSFISKQSTYELVFILIAFATAAYRLMPSVNEILFNLIEVKSSIYIFEQLSFFNNFQKSKEFDIIKFNQSIQLENISYAYNQDKLVFVDISLKITKGDFVVLTGKSGSGKTTLGKILLACFPTTKGTYSIDGKVINHFNQVKDWIGYVTQDFFLFDKSLVENIAIGESIEEIDYHRITEVIKSANLTVFVSSLKDGIYHQVGENGAKISGGQKQRIAIARALYKNTEFLILDEITSAIGKDDELEIINTIYEISKSKNITVFMITHRIASITKYDAMYEMVNGKLEKRGE